MQTRNRIGTLRLLIAATFASFATVAPTYAAGPPAGIDARIINDASEPIPVTGSLGINGTSDVEVTNFPDFPDVQSVEIVNQGAALTSGHAKWALPDMGDPSGSPTVIVPSGVILTDIVLWHAGACFFAIYEGLVVNVDNEIFSAFFSGSGGDTFNISLQSGLEGPLTIDSAKAPGACNGRVLWTGRME